MNFLNINATVRDAIAAHAAFAAVPAAVILDLGFSRNTIEHALNNPGYSVAVWPVTKGSSDSEVAGRSGVYSAVVVRFEVNPQKLKTVQLAHDATPADENTPTADVWLNTKLKAIVAAVLGIAPSNGGIKFQLDADAFEMTNFDEGLLAYHLRFQRLAVFGS